MIKLQTIVLTLFFCQLLQVSHAPGALLRLALAATASAEELTTKTGNDGGTASSEFVFLSSELTGSAQTIEEGDTIDYTLTINNTSQESLPAVKVSNEIPRGAMLTTHSPELAYDDQQRELFWRGTLEPGQEKRFQFRLIAMQDIADTYIINRAVISTIASAIYLQFDTAVRSKSVSPIYRTESGSDYSITELIVIGYLVSALLLIFVVPRLIFARYRADAEMHIGVKVTAPNKKLVYALSIGVAACSAALLGIGFVVHNDIRMFTSYQETQALVTDKTSRSFVSQSSSKSGKHSTHYYPCLAVAYDTDGDRVVSTGTPTRGSFHSTNESKAQAVLSRYVIGKSYPCWYDPRSPADFVMRRTLSWGWYLLGLAPILIAWLGGRYLGQELLGRRFSAPL